MKRIIPLIVVLSLLVSCGTPGRVCGGSGGRRCVEITKSTFLQSKLAFKRNS